MAFTRIETKTVHDRERELVAERRAAAGFAPGGHETPPAESGVRADRSRCPPSAEADKAPPDTLVGLALSGGGVRSAAFNLGLLQALQRFGILRFIDFMSGVSGGSYISAAVAKSISETGRFNREAFEYRITDAGQPRRVRELITNGNYLVRLDLLVSRYVFGLVLNLLPKVAFLVALGAGAAFLWRCLDLDFVRVHLSGIGLDSDFAPALLPAVIAFVAWLSLWLLALLFHHHYPLRTRSRTVFIVAVLSLLIGLAVLLGNGDITWTAAGGAEVRKTTDRWWHIVLMMATAVGLIPFLQPQKLIRSGIAPSRLTDSWVFYYASFALLLGIPLWTIGYFAKENVSKYSTYRGPRLDRGDIIDRFEFCDWLINPHVTSFDAKVPREQQSRRVTLNVLLVPPPLPPAEGAVPAPEPTAAAPAPPQSTRTVESREKVSATLSAEGTAQNRRSPQAVVRLAGLSQNKPDGEASPDGQPSGSQAAQETPPAARDIPPAVRAELTQDDIEKLRREAWRTVFPTLLLNGAQQDLRGLPQWHATNPRRIEVEEVAAASAQTPSATGENDPVVQALPPRCLRCSPDNWKEHVPVEVWKEFEQDQAELRRIASYDPKAGAEAGEIIDQKWYQWRYLDFIRRVKILFLYGVEMVPPFRSRTREQNEFYRFVARTESAENAESRLLAAFNNHALIRRDLFAITNVAAPGSCAPGACAAATQAAPTAIALPEVPARLRDLLAHSTEVGMDGLTGEEVVEMNRLLLEQLLPDVIRPRDQVRRVTVIHADQLHRAIWFLAALIVFLLSGWFIDPNRTSLHEYYRDRLGQTFLSEPPEGAPSQRSSLAECQPHKFGAPYPLIGASVCDYSPWVHPTQLTSPFSPFLLSPEFCGSDELGYRPTKRPADGGNGPAFVGAADLTLADAMAISGAALTPRYFVHHFVMVLMSTLNLQTGKWLPNPERRLDDSSTTEPPKLRPRWLRLLFAEWVRRSRRHYVLVTDGGHVENLGIRELLDRRCRLIIVSDASHDPGYCYADFAWVVRQCREKGIEFLEATGPETPLRVHGRFAGPHCGSTQKVRKTIKRLFGRRIESGDSEKPSPPPLSTDNRRHYFCARIRYPKTNDEPEALGALVYIKPCLTGDEDADIYDYRSQHHDFPHEPTVDQAYDDAQFESYRQLGYHSGHDLCRDIVPAVRWKQLQFDLIDLALQLTGVNLARIDAASPETSEESSVDGATSETRTSSPAPSQSLSAATPVATASHSTADESFQPSILPPDQIPTAAPIAKEAEDELRRLDATLDRIANSDPDVFTRALDDLALIGPRLRGCRLHILVPAVATLLRQMGKENDPNIQNAAKSFFDEHAEDLLAPLGMILASEQHDKSLRLDAGTLLKQYAATARRIDLKSIEHHLVRAQDKSRHGKVRELAAELLDFLKERA